MAGYHTELHTDFVCEEHGDISSGICFLATFKL